MKKIILIILFLPFFAIAQQPRGGGNWKGMDKRKSKDNFKGNISGKVIDKSNKKGLEYATVTLINKRWEKVVEGTITDAKGRYSIKNIPTGDYEIKISFIGYNEGSNTFELTKRKPDIKIEDIQLSSNSEMLSELVITEEKPIYESKIDKIVYNAENDLNEGLDDATDVLRKAPLLTVDLEGDVSLRGSKNIKFLVNGKASSFFTSDISSALQMIPADEIKSVEIITTPGAKYDGEGDAGIVNIITKRKIIDGYKSTINGSFGSRVNRQSANINIGKGRFGLSARGGARYSWPREGVAYYKRENWEAANPQDINTLIDTSNTFSQWIGYNGSVNMFYDINAYNSIMSDIRFGGRKSFSNDSTTYYFNSQDTAYSYNSYIETNGQTKRAEWSTDYIKTFTDNEDRELSLSFQIGGDLGDDDINNFRNNIKQYSTANDEKEIESTIQIDYIHPYLEENNLEIGAKLINRDREIVTSTTSDFNQYSSPQDIFNYKQQVLANYLSTDFILPMEMGLKAGLRHEYTMIKGDWELQQKDEISNSYGNLLPSLTISKEFTQVESIKLSYNTRISRPNVKNINPNILRQNSFNITEGNPELSPANTQQIEISYSNFGRKYQGSYSLYSKFTTDIIESYTRVINGISKNIYENIGSSTTYGFNYFGSYRFNKGNIRAGFNLYQYTGNANIDNKDVSLTSNLLYSYNFGGNYDLGKNWKIEGWGFFRSPSQTIQGTNTSFNMMSFGVKKEFKNKRGSIGLQIVEPFRKYKIFTNEVQGDNFTQRYERHLTFRSFGISFKYTFGKLNFKSSSKKSNIKNDDVNKGGEQDY